jgi:DNA-binding NtrC family response regulator
MRERLDCAVFSTSCNDEWAQSWLGVHAGGRLHVRIAASGIDTGHPDSSALLGHSQMLLRRFDVCLVPVSEQNLSWLRTSLQAAYPLQTPVLALVRHLKATALDDLYNLGLSDFVRGPLCPEELRVRIERLLAMRRYRAVGRGLQPGHGVSENSPDPTEAVPAVVAGCTEDELCSTILERTGLELDAFAVASASRSTSSRESFRVAKNKVIERFERAYINAALGRHSGNIAMAARAAQKHRRAFWALMRKYQIDAASYRPGPASKVLPGG